MKSLGLGRYALTSCVAAAMLAGCGGGSTSVPATQQGSSRHSNSSSSPIQHVVIVVQENRSFNNLFARFPGANGTTRGKMGNKTIRLKEASLVWPCDFGHSRSGFLKDYNGGKMNGFYLEGGGNPKKCPPTAGRDPYQYVNPTQIASYWGIASQYVLADHMFQTQGSGSFTAHQDLIRGGTTFDAKLDQALVDFPKGTPWGCNAPPGTTTPKLVWTGSKIQGPMKGPFPCTNALPPSSSYQTLADNLDAASITWKYYTPPLYSTGMFWNAFDMIADVRYGPEWGTKVVWPETKIFADITNGTLPAVSWVIPDGANSDHPGSAAKDTGPSWVASVVNAIGESTYWDSTAVVIVWDDWGGFYDQVKPPSFDHWGGLGFRVPCLIASPYAREAVPSKPGYISHTQYEFGSILKFIEDNWGLPPLGTTDMRANSIVDSFDFTQPPRKFQHIKSRYPLRYFKQQAPSGIPVDTE
jgi:phospholipase C